MAEEFLAEEFLSRLTINCRRIFRLFQWTKHYHKESDHTSRKTTFGQLKGTKLFKKFNVTILLYWIIKTILLPVIVEDAKWHLNVLSNTCLYCHLTHSQIHKTPRRKTPPWNKCRRWQCHRCSLILLCLQLQSVNQHRYMGMLLVTASGVSCSLK